jgi:SAM-dependent methyltransferase
MATGKPTLMNTIPSRRPYQGVVQILQFNWRFYVATAAAIGLTLLALPFLPSPGRTVLLLGTAPALFWLTSSLLVSHYIYDRSPLYELNWVCSVLSSTPRRWMNVHCGLDETSAILATIFPDSANQVVDIFDPLVMTETSIQTARRVTHPTIPSTSMPYDSITFPPRSFDVVFSIFAAHELRRHDQRVTLFREIVRTLTPDGEFILMEHSRDWPNFLAFGPGFLHFFSRRSWRKAASDAGLTVRTELSITPFVHAYIMRSAK